MKKRYAMLFLSFALMLSLLCTCGQQTEAGGVESMQSTDTDSDNEKTIMPRPECKDVVLGEMYSEEGSVSVPNGPEFQYSYHVPQIKDDTPDAATINEEIANLYGSMVEENLEYVNNEKEPWCNIVGYESYRCGDVLSLVLKCSYYYEYYEEFSTYNYDMAKGERLTNADILLMEGVSEDEYLYAVRRAAAKCYDDWYFPVWEDSSSHDSPWAYQERRSFTLSAKNITPDLPLYLEDDGAIHTIAPIGSHAGMDWLYETLTPDFGDDADDVETNDSLDFMTATRRGNELTLCFQETADGFRILEENEYLDVPYGREIPVNGFYGDYTRIFCGTAGELDWPYVFLLTREGRVEYVDVVKCLNCGYFCAGGPLLGAEDVKDFSTDTDENGLRWIYAITDSGERIELTDLTVVDQRSMVDCFTGGWGCTRTVPLDGGESYKEYVYLELTGGYGDFNMSFDQSHLDYSMEADGYLTYLGMTESGAVYAYHLWRAGSNGPGLNGAVALEMWWDDDDSVLDITELGGTPLIGYQTGDTTSLVRTFG